MGQCHGTRTERTGPNLWSGNVNHDGHTRGNGANATQALDARRNVTVSHREAEDINTGLGEVAEDFVTL
jgi:hypothetical protein